MNFAERYGLPIEGGIIHAEPLASKLILELGLIDKFQIPDSALTPGGAAMKCIIDATNPDYYVAALRFHGFAKKEDNGYAAIVMSKKHFKQKDLIAKIEELESQMEITGARLEIIKVKHSDN
jgi:hypothetical protein